MRKLSVICEAGDVVVVPFPFIDVPVAKRRPAAVLSTRAFNAANGQSVLAMITTAAGSAWKSDVAIRNLDFAGLTHSCFVRWKVSTLPNEVIIRHLGTLGAEDRKALAESSIDAFNLY
jgi:mRNA interferase MazF